MPQQSGGISHEYIAGAGGLSGDADGYLFRSAQGSTGLLSTNPMTQKDVHRRRRLRVDAAGITDICATAASRRWINKLPITKVGT